MSGSASVSWQSMPATVKHFGKPWFAPGRLAGRRGATDTCGLRELRAKAHLPRLARAANDAHGLGGDVRLQLDGE
jgi:hypothetical protein